MICFYYDGNGIVADYDATERDIQLYRTKYGFVADTKPELIRELEKPIPKKVHHLTETEIAAQNEWALTMMTDEEKEMCKQTEKKPIELEQFEFYLAQENITGKDRYLKQKRFWKKFNKVQDRRKSYVI